MFSKEDSICQNIVLLSAYLGVDTFGCKNYQGSLYAKIFNSFHEVTRIFHWNVFMLARLLVS
jgi:hypothetical protein